MVQNYKAIRVTLLASDPATTVRNITGFGFNPNAIRIKTTGRSSGIDAVGAADSRVSFGVAANGSGQGSLGIFYDQGTTACIVGSNFDNDCVYLECNAAATVTGKYAVNAWIADGVQLICNDQIVADTDIIVEGFLDDNVYAGVRLLGSSTTGIKTFNDLGFTPDAGALFYFVGTQLGYAGTLTGFGDEDIGSFSVGVACGASQYVLCLNADDDSATMDTDSYCRAGECIVSIQQDGGASPDMRVAFDAVIAGGFDLDVLESPGFDTAFLVLVLSGGDYAVGDFLSNTDTTTTISETVGFAPLGIATYSHLQAQSAADTAQAGAEMTLGCAMGPSSRLAIGFFDENGTGNMETSSAIEHDAVGVSISTASAVEGLVDVVTLPTATGFDLKNDDADPAQCFYFYEAFGGGTPPGGGDANARLIGGDLLQPQLFGRLVA